MLIAPYVEMVAEATIASDDCDCIISAKTPEHLKCWLNQSYNIKKHQAALFMKFKTGRYSCMIFELSDVPFNDVYDPGTGKAFIRYELEQTGKPGIRIN